MSLRAMDCKRRKASPIGLVIGHQPLELIAGVLAASSGVMDERIGLATPPDRHHQASSEDRLSAIAAARVGFPARPQIRDR